MGPDLQAPPSAPPVETLSPPVFEPAQPTGPDTPATPDKPRR
jgi:hypothetical protein